MHNCTDSLMVQSQVLLKGTKLQQEHQRDVRENDPGGAKRRSPVLTVFGTHKQKLHVDSLRADFVPQVQDYFEQINAK